MRRRQTGIDLLAALFIPALVLAACDRAARAQSDTPSWNRNVPKKTTTRRTPRPRPTPRPTPRPVTPSSPPLSAQYRVLKVNENNSQVEVNPVTVFNRGDRVHIAVKADQNVYLFVIHQPGPGQPGTIFIPDSRINSGQNSLVKDQEFVISPPCAPGAAAYQCSHVVGGGGQESFTLIFSREPTIKLLDDSAASGGSVSPQALDAYADSIGQRLDDSARGDTVFARRFRNLNPRSGGQVVVRVPLNKRG